MKLVLQILFLTLLSFSHSAWSNKLSDEAVDSSIEIANRLNELLANLETFKADFTQNITTETGEQLDQLSGEIAIKKPGKFYWNVTEPFEQQLVADGKYLWQYDIDLEQATVRNLDESLGGTPAEILSGSVTNLSEKFTISCPGESSATTETFLMIPKQEGQFESIQLSFTSGALTLLKLKDTLGQTTTVEFIEAKFGLALDETLFFIKLPDDVELVDSRIHTQPQP